MNRRNFLSNTSMAVSLTPFQKELLKKINKVELIKPENGDLFILKLDESTTQEDFQILKREFEKLDLNKDIKFLFLPSMIQEIKIRRKK